MASQICTHTAALSGWIVCVVEEFTAKNDRVLNLRKGDVIQLVSTKDDDGAPLGDGWLLGKHAASGKIGRYPRACTMLLPKAMTSVAIRPCAVSRSQSAIPETYSSSITTPSNSPRCGICLDTLTDAYALPCGDVFCIDCIRRWLQDSPICPLDRIPIAAEVMDDISQHSSSSSARKHPAPHVEGRISMHSRPHVINQTGTYRHDISSPLDRPTRCTYHSAADANGDPESFWGQLRQLGRLRQQSRQRVAQLGNVAAV